MLRRQERRADRYKLREWLRKHASYGRCRDCGLKLRTAGDPTLRLSGTPGVDAVMGAAGVVTCDQRLCPPCASRIGRREATQIADTLAVHRDTVYRPELARYGFDGGGHALLATFTLRHHLGQSLLFLLGVVGYAWERVITGGGYAKLASEFGIVGWIRSLEITWSRANGWHPHIHMLVLVDSPMSQERAEHLGLLLFAPWQRAVRRKGADALVERGVDVKLCDLGDMSSGVLGAYLSKVGHEVAGAANKSGRDVESFSMSGLLNEVIETYEYTAFRAWQELEFTIAGKRRKFLTWSGAAQDMRARAGHGCRDKTDEELAAEDDLKSDDLIAIEREGWPRVVPVLEQIFRVGETNGIEAVKRELTARGIGWRPMTTAPRRLRRPGKARPDPLPVVWPSDRRLVRSASSPSGYRAVRC